MQLRVLSKIYHMNVDSKSAVVAMPILKVTANGGWSHGYLVTDVILAFIELLTKPNIDCGDETMRALYKSNPAEYLAKAKSTK